MPKPFSPRELTARVKAVLRRAAPGPRADELTLGPLRVSRARGEAWVGDREVLLTAKELELLAYLVENAGLVVSRSTLLEHVWQHPLAQTRTVEVHVAQLRKKLGRPDLIRTVRGSGYKAVAG